MPLILMQLIDLLAWLIIPVGLVCILDDWVFRPRRELAAGAQPPPEPTLTLWCYRALPVLLLALVVRIYAARMVSFSAVLLVISVLSGLIWLIDARWLAKRRAAAARAAGREPAEQHEPTTVDYARSFFPVALAVLLVRAFLFEPFRIPSDSMMPTLRDGDFILVEKFAYGLRLPIVHTKILDIGAPKLGQVAVFRPPFKPWQDWIKRVAGLPGDHVVVRDDRLIINGKKIPMVVNGIYKNGCYRNIEIATEYLGKYVHQVLLCPEPLAVTEDPLPTCPRTDAQGYICGGTPPPDAFLLPKKGMNAIVPPGDYVMIGDNRDNSEDSRFWGFLPGKDLVGKATYIWFNWDIHRKGGPIWSRIGMKIK